MHYQREVGAPIIPIARERRLVRRSVRLDASWTQHQTIITSTNASTRLDGQICSLTLSKYSRTILKKYLKPQHRILLVLKHTTRINLSLDYLH